MHRLINFLKPLVYTRVWDILKTIALSVFFRIFLEILAFFGGFPPEQPVYFHEYMKDAFGSRAHTYGLLNLILALDEELQPLFENLDNRTLICSGYPDFLTGVYIGYELSKHLKNSKHVVFRMGSHFLILEWPGIVAKEIIITLLDN